MEADRIYSSKIKWRQDIILWALLPWLWAHVVNCRFLKIILSICPESSWKLESRFWVKTRPSRTLISWVEQLMCCVFLFFLKISSEITPIESWANCKACGTTWYNYLINPTCWMFFFNFKKSISLKLLAIYTKFKIPMDTCHTPKLDFFTKQNPTPPPPLFNHLNLHVYFWTTFPKSHRIHTQLQREEPTHLVEHRDINIDPKNFQHLAHSFCGMARPPTWKNLRKKKHPQSGTNYFPKVYNLTILFSFFSFPKFEKY